jgi:hypothetical protein
MIFKPFLGQCRCPFNHHPNWGKDKCLKDVELNETCFRNEECVAENSICYGTCRCRTSHVLSQDGKRCLPLAASLYQKCQENQQCSQIAFTYCGSNNTCICLKNHHDINSVRITEDSNNRDASFVNVELSLHFFQRCHVTVMLDGVCEDDLNCVQPNSMCINRKCKCAEGFHEENNFNQKICSEAKRVQISFLILVTLTLSLMRL